MKKLDFNPSKSKQDFRNNYKLHDLAEFHGKNLLTQWGVEFTNFGEDKRYERVWEKGADKPDVAVTYNNKSALIDWKGKKSKGWLLNKRAAESYIQWSVKLNVPILIIFFVFDGHSNLLDKRVADFRIHHYRDSASKQWDKNVTVEFLDDLPEFTKVNLLNLIG